MSKDEGIMADPYASGSSPPPASSLPSFGGFTLPPPEPAVPAAAQPDYLFTENYDAAYRRSWGERLTFHIGAAYLAGAPAATALCAAAGSGLWALSDAGSCTLLWSGRSVDGRHVRHVSGSARHRGRATPHPDQQRAQRCGTQRPALGQLARVHRCVLQLCPPPLRWPPTLARAPESLAPPRLPQR